MDRLEQINAMLQENPDDNFLNYAAALEFKKRNDPKRSIEILEKLITKNSDYLAAYYQLGKLYEEICKFDAARMIYEKGTEIAASQGEQKTLTELKEALVSLV